MPLGSAGSNSQWRKMSMQKGKTVLPVLVGIVVFATAALQSLFVEGDITGTVVPGLHPTTEMVRVPLASLERGLDSVTDAAVEVKTEAFAKAAPSVSVPMPAESTDSVPEGYVYWKTVRAKVTAYEPGRRSCGKFANGKTSIGHNAWNMDGVATDPKAIPYGVYCDVPGIGIREVDDTGSAMRKSWRRYGRYHIDVRMPYYYQAKRWGVKYLDVKLYKKAS